MSRLDDLERRIEALERELRISKAQPLLAPLVGTSVSTPNTGNKPYVGGGSICAQQALGDPRISIGGFSTN